MSIVNSLRPYCHAGGASDNAHCIFKSHKDSVRWRIKGYIAVALVKDPEGRRRVVVDLRGDAGGDG